MYVYYFFLSLPQTNKYRVRAGDHSLIHSLVHSQTQSLKKVCTVATRTSARKIVRHFAGVLEFYL